MMATGVKRPHSNGTRRTQSHPQPPITLPFPTSTSEVGDRPASADVDIWAESCSVPAPFTNESICQRRRDAINYSLQITKEVAAAGTAGRPVRIYADGIYDMFHSGHARQLIQAKCMFPSVYLMVGVCNDALTYKMKGRTVMNEVERYEAVRHCRYVDELVQDAPWSLDAEFLKKHKIDFVAHDDLPYGAGSEDDIYKWIKDAGRFVATERTEGISTTDVITRIIRDYDLYVRRNLARGYTAKELNVGFMKEKRLQFQNKVGAVKSRVDHVKERIAGKSHELLNKWEEMSRDFVSNFVELFGRDGRINHWIREGRRKVVRAISPPPFAGAQDSGSNASDDSPTSSPVSKRNRFSYDDRELLEEEEEEDEDEEDDENQLQNFRSSM